MVIESVQGLINSGNKIIEFVDKETPSGGRSSIQLIAEKGKETFYENSLFIVLKKGSSQGMLRSKTFFTKGL